MQKRLKFEGLEAEICVSEFTGADAITEYQIAIELTHSGSLEEQLSVLDETYTKSLGELGISIETSVWRRFYLSDPANQYELLEAHPLASCEASCAISLVGQAPLSGSKLALLAYHVSDISPLISSRKDTKRFELQRGKLCHQWCDKFSCPSDQDAQHQTVSIFDQYCEALRNIDGNLLEHAVRTWIYVRDVDHNYAGVVSGRNAVFEREGLTPETHYIASTGIESRFGKFNARVFMETYSIAGLLPEQLEYLHAEDHLNRTDDYGVAFERATAVSYKDRKHILISGTASIDENGEILHSKDVLKQFDRALENVAALLEKASAKLEDMSHWIVYMRDPADTNRIKRAMQEQLGDTPAILVAGSVCRPGWLIEVEGAAVIAHTDESLPRF